MVEFHSISGTGNNLAKPDLNAAGQPFTRLAPAAFGPNGAPSGGPNPRLISNVVIGEGDATGLEAGGRSGMTFAFGQFLDHDMSLQRSDPNGADISIPAPDNDPVLNDGDKIPVKRAFLDADRNPINRITGWLDASQIYGSDEARMESLRGENGRLRTSAGNNLPIINGQLTAGDVRAAENPFLASLHTIFLREHNRLADAIAEENPRLSSDEIFGRAREIVIGELQAIIYNEFLPTIIGDVLPDYDGYDPTIDPSVTAEFAAAAFRFGHTLVASDIDGQNNSGRTTTHQSLKDAFGTDPKEFAKDTADAFMRHFVASRAQAFDARIVDDLRNFLSDGTPAIDLASLNIARGRDFGVPKLNDMRDALGLDPLDTFDEITSDRKIAEALEDVYASPDDVDLWVGGLAEDPARGSLMGETFQNIIAEHFLALRDGDRLWHQNQDWSDEELAAIEATKLSDVIARNTNTRGIQDNAFEAANRRLNTNTQDRTPGADELIIGSKKDRVVSGGSGDDTIVPGARNNQVLKGGRGNDLFQFPGDENHKARIADFRPGDRLDFGSSVTSMDDVSIKRIAGGIRVRADGNTVDLSGVRRLDESDFRFIPQLPIDTISTS